MSYYDTMALSGKHRRTIAALFSEPVTGNVPWRDVESLLKALGAQMSEGRESRLRVYLNGVRAVFHRPHPRKESGKGAVKSLRRFLLEAGLKLEE